LYNDLRSAVWRIQLLKCCKSRVTLLALSHIKPGLETVGYETLRTAIRDVLAEGIPQAHEVTRVIEKMAEIAASDESSTPVIDWDKGEQELHITDPFFAFYLKWGVSEESLRSLRPIV
jgi:hypothetical protein